MYQRCTLTLCLARSLARSRSLSLLYIYIYLVFYVRMFMRVLIHLHVHSGPTVKIGDPLNIFEAPHQSISALHISNAFQTPPTIETLVLGAHHLGTSTPHHCI